MKAGKYCIKDLFVNRYIQRIIIPEIQRDYVWGETQVNGLLSSIVNDFNKYLVGETPEVISDNETDIQAINSFYRKRKYASNIGFIYAYNDPAYDGKYFLIDGQQRVTTLYILLAALANRNKPLRSTFSLNYCNGNELKLGYKVRVISDELLNEFVNHVITKDTDVNDQLWLLNSYKNDATGRSIINNYNTIQLFLDELEGIDEIELFTYIEELTEFWYFDTNVSEQGEELYIYMNARGEQMQSNENIKADLLGGLKGIDEKNSYGEKWECWQDLFWKNKDQNATADKGFNQFLTSIAGLEYYLQNDLGHFYSKNKFEGKVDGLKGVKLDDVLNVLDIKLIETYFKALEFLVKTSNAFMNEDRYSNWVSSALKDFWKLFNDKSSINWFADYRDRNRNTERNSMVFVWTVLLYVKKQLSLECQESQEQNTMRFFRRVYLRFKNNNRSVSTIENHIEITLINGVIDTTDNIHAKAVDAEIQKKNNVLNNEDFDKTVLTSDEVFKNKIILNCSSIEKQKIAEDLIWEIEDHPYNLNGSGVGNLNLSHLFEIPAVEVDIDYLKRIRGKFQELFPKIETKEKEVKLIEILLLYGEFYDRVTPYYYQNLKFNNWRRIIRNIGTELKDSTTKPFMLFFQEFLRSEDDFDVFYKKKMCLRIEKETALTVKERIRWYSQQLGQSMWSEGYNIAISNGSPCGLKDWGVVDEIFDDSYKYYNIKGNLKGGNPIILSEILE